MSSALVGYTGFVGGNILKGYKFDHLYNSVNFSEIQGMKFDLLVFSAASAAKWMANADPEKDKQHIDSLIKTLKTVSADRFVLISTIDVYKNPRNVTEDSETLFSENHPYGLNRGRLEEFVKTNFSKSHILRLPGLYGPGIKKNVIFDFLNNNDIEKIDSRGSFQFYNLNYITRDIQRVIEQDLSLINIAVEPVLVSEVYELYFGKPFVNKISDKPAVYDFRSNFAALWGAPKEGYLYSRRECLEDLRKFMFSYGV
ncbi:MAG TPA: hypothetical protein VIG33_09275 [Pseudobdellovibrionaceae bacterium]|jgi:hypothetical protein